MAGAEVRTLALLGLVSAVADAFQVVYVPQSVVDDIRDAQLISEDALLKEVSDSLARHAAFQVAAPEREEVSPLEPEAAVALATQENDVLALVGRLGVPLLADDLGIRDLALLHEGEAFGTRAFLELALSRGIVDRPTYRAAIVKLIRENHYFISYNGRVLADTIRASDYQDDDDTKALVGQLWKPDAEVESYAHAFAVAISELWTASDSGREARRSEWTGTLLTQLAVRGGPRMVVGSMARAIVRVSNSNPSVLRTLLFEMFNVWADRLGITDDFIATAATAIARDYAVGVLERRVEAAALKAYVAALDMHWLQRVKRLMRETSPDLYPLVFE